jgi:pimeloyl-ACP methyl ester carboxylesterase
MSMKRLFLLLSALMLSVSCTQTKIEIRSKGVVLRDDTVVHYREAGQGPVLILIHGLGSSSEAWQRNMESLGKSYRVIAIDLPGYGKSDKPKADYSVEYHTRVVAEFLEHLGAGKAVLAGNSLGGWIAALAALEHPEKVSGLILINSAGLRHDTSSPVSLNPSNKDEERALLLALFADKSLVTDKLVRDQWEYRKDVRSTVQAAQESFKAKLPLLDDRLKEIKTPTLVIWGRQDPLIPLEIGERFARGISGSKMVIIDNAGHLPQVEQPEVFAKAVKSFIKSW